MWGRTYACMVWACMCVQVHIDVCAYAETSGEHQVSSALPLSVLCLESGSLTEAAAWPASSELQWSSCLYPPPCWGYRHVYHHIQFLPDLLLAKLGSYLLITASYLQPQSIFDFQNTYQRLCIRKSTEDPRNLRVALPNACSIKAQMWTFLGPTKHETNHVSTGIFDKFTSYSDTHSKGSNSNTWYKDITFTFLELVHHIFAWATQQGNTVLNFLSSPQSADSWHNRVRTGAVGCTEGNNFQIK